MTWWQWPFWSAGRLLLTLAVIAAVAIGVNLATSGHTPDAAGPATTSAQPASRSEMDRAAATKIATLFVPAWTTPDPARRRALLAPIATEQLIDRLDTVPAEQLAFAAAGPAAVTFTGAGQTTVEVPLSTGSRAILGIVSTPRGWLVETAATSMADL